MYQFGLFCILFVFWTPMITSLSDIQSAKSKTTTDTALDPPLEFPLKDVKFLNNSALLKNFTQQEETTDTEVEDLRRMNTEEYYKNARESESGTTKISESVRFQAEEIEDGSNTEEVLKNHSHIYMMASPSEGSGVALIRGQIAAILAAVFVIISVVAYAGLLSWRRYLENRYGSREILVEDDDFSLPNDRNFSI